MFCGRVLQLNSFSAQPHQRCQAGVGTNLETNASIQFHFTYGFIFLLLESVQLLKNICFPKFDLPFVGIIFILFYLVS